MSTPAPGATVTEAMTDVQLYFTEKVASNAYFTITAPDGGRVDHSWRYGEPKPLDKPVREYVLVNGTFEPREYTTGFPAVVQVAHLPAAGQYSVSYLSVASDGEPVRGSMTFRYTGRPTAAPAGWSRPTDQPDAALMAAVQQHETSGHGPGAETTSAAPPVSAAPPALATGPAADDDGGPGLLLWWGVAVALVAMVAGFVVWRLRPTSAGRPSGRSRTSGVASRRRGAGSRTTGASSARKGQTPGRGGADRRASSAHSGDTRRPTAVAAARKRVEAATAGIAAATGSTAGQDAGPATAATNGNQQAAAPAGQFDGPRVASTFGPHTSTARLAVLVGSLVVALLVGFGLGRTGAGEPTAAGTQAGPASVGAAATEQAASAAAGHQHAPGTGPHTHPGDGSAGQAQATGTTVSAGGYTLQPVQRSQPAGQTVDYRFRILGTNRQAATQFVTVHDKPLHLVVVGRDLSGYQHLHPTMASDGTWSVPLRLARAGTYRIYADFTVTTDDATPKPLVLGADHHVPGAYAPVTLPSAQTQAKAGPFTVQMTGTPTAGVTVPMAFGVGRDGTAGPVQVQRYLGAYGHLVVVREGDLGYVHVHPEPDLVNGAITFWLTAPSAGRYRAFFDFQVDGRVHTAQYTIDIV
ncbi:methionine-rich copper-binding protein CopC [Micromonospora endolithica]|nr:methionine-rich copper-binding protein CopC [Micromonospora endolithica]